MASTRLKNPATGASVQSERRTLTWSGWIKKCGQGADQDIYTGRYSGSYFAHLAFDSTDKIRVRQYAGGTNAMYLQTTAVYRDPNAWYHIVMAIDTTQSTASNRAKLYVNGEQVTAFDDETYPSQNLDTYWQMTGTDSYPSYLGWDGTYYFNGVMSDVYIIGGTAYPASTFGSTDATTGEWKPNTNPTISYGTGVAGNAHLKFDDTSNFGKNSATGFTSNHWSVDNGTMTKTEDNPSNNFATLNELARLNNFSQRYVEHTIGNTKADGTSTSNNGNSYSTLGASSGKFYCEAKINGVYNTIYPTIGVIPERNAADRDRTQIGYNTSDTFGYTPDGQKIISSSQSSYGDSFTNGDIIGIALDLDNGAVYFSKNGTWQNSGDPTSGSSKTNAAGTFTPSQHYFMGVSPYRSQSSVSFNFGNGYFGTTAISSEGTNASGLGKFEYDVPAGYTALCTKGLNE